jgi:LAS superfamily LD-carboxypeptidase LdcB
MNDSEITGCSHTHIVVLEHPRCALHYAVVTSFLAMRDAAAQTGIDLQCRSSFRDFKTQLGIWNSKWRGERPLYSRDGRILNHAALSPDEVLDAILTWSAIPGGSRHHWGSDVDLIDAAAIPTGYAVQLTPPEYAAGGVFAKLSAWLDRHAAQFGFFRPYQTDRGGVSREPWHLSYAPVSLPALESLSLSTLRQVLEHSELEGKQQVLARLPEIYTQFLLNIDPPTAAP